MAGLDAQRVNGVTVWTGGSEPWRGSLSDRILIAENRCAAFFVSPWDRL
jgi:nicotinate-nucleotide pyrophosphorylase